MGHVVSGQRGHRLMTALLDRLEAVFTWQLRSRKRENVAPHWAWISPSLVLREDETFKVGTIVREGFLTPLVCSVYFFAFVLGILAILFHFDARLHHATAVHERITRLAIDAFITRTPEFIGIWFLLHLPAFYFWNRRAKRLQGQQAEPVPPTIIANADPTVWPPPPKLPDSS